MSAGLGEGSAVAEFQGLDGAFSFAERLLQRIWSRGDFDATQARTADGLPVKILFPGKWNRLGGPDFFGARLEIGGTRVQGDVELHLRAVDWTAHGHAADPKYDRVVLHVTLYPPHGPTLGVMGKRIPVLALLPLLYRSLEEHAEDEAVERLANHPLSSANEALLALPLETRRAELLACAEIRWQQKIRFAANRISRLGWSEACHHTALEILGYRFNRGPMLFLAAQQPLDRWPAVAEGAALERLIAEHGPRWNRQAVRPANHPATRLRQYARWTGCVPRWPEHLATLIGGSALAAARTAPSDTAGFRAHVSLVGLTDRIGTEACGGAVGGTRLPTLIQDGFLPLLAADAPDRADALRNLWFHGYPGDLPDRVPRLLGALELTHPRLAPLCHGLAQGLLGWVWREEERQEQTTACPCGRGT